MRIVEQYTQAKSTTTPSEDAVVVNAYFAAVIDGATPKSSFRLPGGETPGHLAARMIAEAIVQLPADVDAHEAIQFISSRMREAEGYDHMAPADRPIASLVLYSAHRREVWMVGDCQFLLPENGEAHQPAKRIDALLAAWRRDVDLSLLSRGIMTAHEIALHDPGRRIIQPHISGQVRFQNRADHHPLAYAMLDGQPVPPHLIEVFPLPAHCCRLVLASDGYPRLFSTLQATEQHLQQLLQSDPLCLGPLLGTKGIRPGNVSYDDRSYLSLQLL